MLTADTTPLSLFLKRIALAPHSRACHQAFSVFPNDFSFASLTLTDDLHRQILLAGRRLSRMEEVAPPLRELMEKLHRLLYVSLKIDPLLQSFLAPGDLENSFIDNYLTLMQTVSRQPSFSDLLLLLGSDWGGWKGGTIYEANTDPIESLRMYYSLIFAICQLKGGSPSAWPAEGIGLQAMDIAHKLKRAKEGALAPPTEDELEKLKTSGETIYYPVGYANSKVFFIHLLAMDYACSGYRLRLLAADNSYLLAASKKPDHYCPEVIWEGLTSHQLREKKLWKPLLDWATIKKEEAVENEEKPNNLLAFRSDYLVPWLTRRLGKRPVTTTIQIEKLGWEEALQNQHRRLELTIGRDSLQTGRSEDLMLQQTGKAIKRTCGYEFTLKFAHLLALDRISSEKERLLFKAEIRLLLLTGCYLTLHQAFSPPLLRGKFLKLIEQSFGKVSAPLERLVLLDPSKEQRETARLLLISLLDLKHRVNYLASSRDKITLAIPRPLYRSTHTVAHLDFSKVWHRPIKLSLFDTLRVNEGAAPLPSYAQWTPEHFREIYDSLEKGYDTLLDAQLKCEPVEILLLAHRLIFSRLPIPSTDKVETLFPEPLSEGLLVGTLLLLKKISSLVAAELYSESFIPPLFVVDMARVYRFAFELYRHIHPPVRKLPISWFALHQYLKSRHSLQTAGEIRSTLEKLCESFRLISPQGHLRPSSEFKEIPVFYFSWKEFPLDYVFHRRSLAPFRIYHTSIDEILSLADLADSVGLKSEETELDGRWQNSFGGQCFLTLKEMAFMHTLTVFGATESYRECVQDKGYRVYCECNLGPEDAFLVCPPTSNSFYCHFNRMGIERQLEQDILAGQALFSHRMVALKNGPIQEPFNQLPHLQVEEWRDQAELLKALPKQSHRQESYFLHQVATGPASLSIDLLLEYFELRSALLLNQDYRSFFLAVLRSATILESACSLEPLLLNRLRSFMETLSEENRPLLSTAPLYFERHLWLTVLCSHLCTLERGEPKLFSPLLEKMIADLYPFASLARVAAHLLACQKYLVSQLTLVEQARLHLLVGQDPPQEANDFNVWLEATVEMQQKAPLIQAGLLQGEEETRRALWSLILNSEEEVEKALCLRPQNISFETLLKTSAEIRRLELKESYLQRWNVIFKKSPWRRQAWREEATTRLLKKVQEALSGKKIERAEFIGERLFAATSTGFALQLGGRIITVDWESGRMRGGADLLQNTSYTPASYIPASYIPAPMRKHPDLAPLNQILRQKYSPSSGSRIRFEEVSYLSLDLNLGAAYLNYEGDEFRLVSPSHLPSLALPDPLNEGFSVWMKTREGSWQALMAAHDAFGKPLPLFGVDYHGTVRQLAVRPPQGNGSLRLATQAAYPEAQLFFRWGLTQNNLLVWLDEEHHVAELTLPLYHGQKPFTRVIRSDKGWEIEGLELQLEETHEGVAAFAGHPVYLVAKNMKGERLLLLPGISPYEIEERQKKSGYEVNWNLIFSSKVPLEEQATLHQYRITPTGEVEGLTVADNLLLMLWMLKMGHYERSIALAKRWLTPPGRPYTKEEEKILSVWVGLRDKNQIEEEAHPAALSLRLYVIVRMARHLRHYPSISSTGKLSPLALALNGPRFDRFGTSRNIQQNLMGRVTLGRQLRSTQFEELFSLYDHEAALRLLIDEHRESRLPLARRLYQRLNQFEDSVTKKIRLTCKISDHQIHYEASSGQYVLKKLIEEYPNFVQATQVPVDLIYRSLALPKITCFFDRAYKLIVQGAKTPAEEKEYSALLHGINELRGDKALDLSVTYFLTDNDIYRDLVHQCDLFLWLLLEQVLLAQKAGKKLPQLPSVERRFGLALQSSQEAAEAFFNHLVALSGIEAETLFNTYCHEWFSKRELHLLEQRSVALDPPPSFQESLKSPWSPQLTQAMASWSHLTFPKQPIQRPYFSLSGWNYPLPTEWATLPLDDLKAKMADRLSFLLAEKEKRKKELLARANPLPQDENKKVLEFARQIHYRAPLSLDECLSCALTGYSHHQSHDQSHDQSRLDQAVLAFLEVALEVAHLKRASEKLSDQLPDQLPDQEDSDLQAVFIEELFTPHHYLPHTDNLPLMLTEYYGDLRLRVNPSQAQLIDALTTEMTRGTIIQAIPGSGKSKIMAPIWLQSMLGKGWIPILSVPNSLFQTTLSDLQDMMWSRFKTQVRALTFSREQCSETTLHHLAENFHLATIEPTVFVTTPRDLHAFQLMLKERHQIIEDMRERLIQFTLAWADSLNLKAPFQEALARGDWQAAEAALPPDRKASFARWKQSHVKLEEELKPFIVESNLLQANLNLCQNSSPYLIDEVAASYDPRNLLSFPIGWQVPANPQAAYIGCKLYFEWLPPYFEELSLLNNMQSLSKEASRQLIYRKLAQKGWEEYLELLPNLPPLETFTAYMLSDLSQGRQMESFVLQLSESPSLLSRQLSQELAYLKYCLSTGLEGALSSTGYVHYGRSKQDQGLYLAIPYQCANIPKENTLFRRPWKTILMTCQLYSQEWKDERQTSELIGFLRGIDPASKDKAILQAAHQIWGRRFSDADLSDAREMQELTKRLDAARTQLELAPAARKLIATYLQSCVFPVQLKLDPAQLTSTPQDLPMMGLKADGMGGTFSYEATWNPKLLRLPDNSIDRTLLKILTKPCNQRCHLIPKGGADSFFAAIKSGALEEYMAIMDAGALFKGLSNEMVAERLLASLKGFDSILFYDEQHNGAHLAVLGPQGKRLLESSDHEGVRRALRQLKLSHPFTYYDQARCIGADLELREGRALVTFSDSATIDDLIQAAMRCRYLLNQRHAISYAVPEEMEGDWTGDRVIETAKAQKRKVEDRANFHGISEQLKGAARSLIDKAMRSTPDFESRHLIYQKAKSFLMEEQSNDLVKTFASLHGMVKSKEALRRLCRQLIDKIEKIFPEKKEALSQTFESILSWHEDRGTALPEWVVEGEVEEDAVQEVDLSKDLDKCRLMEEEYERMLGTRTPKKEVAWTLFNPLSISPSPLGHAPDKGGMPALYQLQEAIRERGYAVPFAPNLLISANLLTTFVGESNCLLTENQKLFHRLLFIRQKEPTLALLTEGDANHLKKLLSKLGTQQGKGVYLVEPNGAINQRGYLGEEISHLWQQGSVSDRSLLLQTILFQGSALLLERLPLEEVRAALDFWLKRDRDQLKAARLLFEAALSFREDDLLCFRRSQKLRALF